MTNRQSIVENFIPFFEKYMLPWTEKRKTFETFEEINIRFGSKDHHSLEGGFAHKGNCAISISNE